jgi:hypothetical protein
MNSIGHNINIMSRYAIISHDCQIHTLKITSGLVGIMATSTVTCMFAKTA